MNTDNPKRKVKGLTTEVTEEYSYRSENQELLEVALSFMRESLP